MRRSIVIILGLAGALALGPGCDGCSGCGDEEPSGGAGLTAAEPAVPEPAGVMGEVVVPAPDATWKAVQAAVGGPLSLLSPTFGGVVGSVLGESALAELVDGGQPAYVVLSSGVDGGAPHAVVAMHLRDPARARDALLEREDAPRTAGGSEQGIEVLEAKGQPGAGVVGLARGGFVLVASSREELGRFGPYAYRTLPTLPLPKSAVAGHASRAALSGPLRAWLAREWDDERTSLLAQDERARRAHQGREPDFGDPKQVVAGLDGLAKRWVDALGDADAADLTADVRPDGIGAEVDFTVSHDGPARALLSSVHTGDTAALAGCSADAIACVAWHTDAKERQETARELAGAVRATLGARLPAADGEALGALFAAQAHARGDWSAVSLSWGASHGVALRTATSDDAAAARWPRDLLAFARRPASAKLLRGAADVTRIEAAAHDFGAAGKGETWRVVTAAVAGSPVQGTLGHVTWASKPGELFVGAGDDSNALVASAAAPLHALGDDAKAKAALARLGGNASFAVVARPLRASLSPRSDVGLLAFGKRGDDGVVWLDVAGVLLRQLVDGAL